MWKFCQYLYNKQNITWPLADMDFFFSQMSAVSANGHVIINNELYMKMHL